MQDWQKNYFALLFGLALLAAYLPLYEDTADWKVCGSQLNYVHLTYFVIAALSLGPTVHWILLHGGFDNDHVVVSSILLANWRNASKSKHCESIVTINNFNYWIS